VRAQAVVQKTGKRTKRKTSGYPLPNVEKSIGDIGTWNPDPVTLARRDTERLIQGQRETGGGTDAKPPGKHHTRGSKNVQKKGKGRRPDLGEVSKRQGQAGHPLEKGPTAIHKPVEGAKHKEASLCLMPHRTNHGGLDLRTGGRSKPGEGVQHFLPKDPEDGRQIRADIRLKKTQTGTRGKAARTTTNTAGAAWSSTIPLRNTAEGGELFCGWLLHIKLKKPAVTKLQKASKQSTVRPRHTLYMKKTKKKERRKATSKGRNEKEKKDHPETRQLTRLDDVARLP